MTPEQKRQLLTELGFDWNEHSHTWRLRISHEITISDHEIALQQDPRLMLSHYLKRMHRHITEYLWRKDQTLHEYGNTDEN